MKYKNIREEELKNKVAADWFKQFDATEIIGNIDFTIFPKQDVLFGRTPLLWAEAKTGDFDIVSMFVQLILTIGKARTFDKTLPPAFLGVFDFKKIAFVPYINVQDIFYLNDFNWNVTSSNHQTKEFLLIKHRIEDTLKQHTYQYDFVNDEKDLITFIRENVAKATPAIKIKIDKNNFIPIYLRWLEIVKPIIDVDWETLKKAHILDNDFYLADLFVDDNNTQNIDDDVTIRDSLFVVFKSQGYKIAKENIKQMFDATITIKNKDVYQQFWKRYKRPPIKEFQDYIIERRDLLVPQDIRERKGAFFTPRKWVELSQKYLTDYLGENWQDDYYIWDCAAGTGNLLAGLTNKYNIYASTLDQADVNVMHERIDHGANLLKNHVFQFDFLNDDFTKLPQSLQDIINDEMKRKKLVIYINPPYAESGNKEVISGKGKNKSEVALSKTYYKYQSTIGTATRELFTQFLTRIYAEIPNAKIANFSTLKNLQSSNFSRFRSFFQASLKTLFLVPADTFDNVKGQFPIGFFVWNTEKVEIFNGIVADLYDHRANFLGQKTVHSSPTGRLSVDWLRTYFDKKSEIISYLRLHRNDIQNKDAVFITSKPSQSDFDKKEVANVTAKNLVEMSIYCAIRQAVLATWLNDRDQYLFPNDNWKKDKEFQNDCLAFTIFNNKVQSQYTINHWIPFTEHEVNAKNKFASNFMTDFINGKLKADQVAQNSLFADATNNVCHNQPREFSDEAKSVFNAGRALWQYYHAQPNVDVNASLYDIREYFQGRNAAGRMNAISEDEQYSELIAELRNKRNALADKIKPKVYEYEFLKE